MQLTTADTDFGRLSYLKFGAEKEDAIFIFPGMGMHADCYSELAEILSEWFRVIVWYHPGIKPTQADNSGIPTMAKVLRMAVNILENEGLDRAHFAGESYGGMLAMGMACSHPARVTSLVLISSSTAGRRRVRIQPRGVFSILKEGFNHPRIWSAVADQVFSKEYLSTANHKQEWLKRFTSGRPFPLKAASKQMVIAASFYGRRLPLLKLPTLVVYGDADHFVPPVNSREIAQRIPGAKLISLEGKGHHLCGEAPRELSSKIIDFIDETTG